MASHIHNIAWRILEEDEHAGHDHGHGDEHEDEIAVGTVNTMPLRIAAIFIICVSSLLGGLPPLFFKAFKSRHDPMSLLLRAFSAGVILSLALVHVVVEAIEDLTHLVEDYHGLGGACILFGVVAIVIIESGAHAYFINATHSHSHSTTCITVGASQDLECAADSKQMANSHTHDHLLDSQDSSASSVRLKVIAYVFEVGCIFHSVIIGVTLGVVTDSEEDVISLLLALIFHQMLEGVSLGNVVTRAGFGRFKSIFMVVCYSLTTPVGIAIGIGIAETYDPSSVTAMAVRGVLNGVAAGILLYIALVQLIAEDFLHNSELFAKSPKLCYGMYGLFILGAGLMAMLGIWA